jgi:DNA repair protein RadC
LGGEEREHFEAAFLNTRHQLIAAERLFSGTVDGAEVHPRIVIQRAMALNAAAILLAHNHPSGHTEPSAADRALTARLKVALGLVDVRLLDHFVVTAGEAVSMAARGWV